MNHPKRAVRGLLIMTAICCCSGAGREGEPPTREGEAPAEPSVREVPAGLRAAKPITSSRLSGGPLVDRLSVSRLSDAPWYRTSWFALTAVLSVAVLGLHLLRRYVPAIRKIGGAGVLEVLARVYLSPKHSVALIRCGRRLVLAGVGHDRVDGLCVIDNPEEVAELTARAASRNAGKESASSRNFDEQLVRETSTYAPDALDELETPLPSSGLIDQTRGQLRDLLAKVNGVLSKAVA